MCRGGLRPPYLLMTLGFCIVLSSCALLFVGCCLAMLEGIVLSSCALLLVGAVLSFECVATTMVAAKCYPIDKRAPDDSTVQNPRIIKS